MAKKKKLIQKLLPDSATADISDPEETPFGDSGAYGNDRRIQNCPAARELYVRLYLEGQLRSQAYAQIRNQIEGGRPFDPAVLQSNAEGWRTNVNFNDARASFRRVSLPYYKMVHEVPQTISCTLHTNAPNADTWGLIMAQNFDRFLDDWGSDYYMQFSGMCDDFVMFGTGYSMFPDSTSPRYKWAQTVQLFFPKRTKASVDDWELVVLKREMTADQLIKLVRDKKEAGRSKEAGWNPDAVMKAIKLAQPGPQTTRYFDPNYWQDMIVNNDLVIGGVWPPISVVDVWATNRDATKIRHYIFTEKADVQEYLYEADEESDSYRQIFAPLFYGVGSNGLIHSIKGFGVMNYYYATAINRTKCRALDSATFAMGMNFTKSDDTPDGSPPVENVSMLNIFPKGLNQLQWYPNLSVGIELMQSLQQNQNENNFLYSEVKQSIADTDTATQAKLIAAVGAEMGTSTGALFLAQMGQNHFTEMMRRLCKKGSSDPDAKKFQDRCRKMGVPDAALYDIERTIKTGATPMMADPAQRVDKIMQARAVLYNTPGANRRWFDEQFVADLLGADAVTKALLPEGVASDPAARRQAMMENVDLAQGIGLPAAPEDAHVEHLDEHLKPLENIVQAAQQGQMIDPNHLLALQMGLAHSQQHLQYLSQDETKKPEFQQLKARFSQVQSVAQGIMARMARAQQQGVSPQGMQSQLQAPPQ